MQKMIEKK